MSIATNPLLIAVRSAPTQIECQRAYTTAYKDGSFRVKLYGTKANILDQLPTLVDHLKVLGFADVSARFLRAGVDNTYRNAVVIKAHRAPIGATKMKTTYTLTFESSQPLTAEQILHVQNACFAAVQTLPYHDKVDFSDVPEFTTDVTVTSSSKE